MNESRICQLLLHSRSRHEVVPNPELRRISRQWQAQKRASRDSDEGFRKMLRELRYFSQLNEKLSKEVIKGRKNIRVSESIRERYDEDHRRKEKCESLRLQEKMRNSQAAARIKEDRFRRVRAEQRDIFAKKSLGDMSRFSSRRLREERAESRLEQYVRNKGRVEQVVEFECNLKESAVRRKESDNLAHIRHHQLAIHKQKESIKLRENKSVEIRKKLKSLTEMSRGKLHILQDVSHCLAKFKSPYHTPIVNRRRLDHRLRCLTEKDSAQLEQQSTLLFISQHHHDL